MANRVRRVTLLTNPDVCNLHCPLCFLNQRGSAFGMGEMPWSVAKESIERYAWNGNGSRSELKEIIPSTMGEPLLYSHFEKLLDFCFGMGISLNITTNGSFPGKWDTEEYMAKLLLASSDIKISCMAFDEMAMEEMMAGIPFSKWKKNVEGLAQSRQVLLQRKISKPFFGLGKIPTLSLQVTLHSKILSKALDILSWAKSLGLDRIKWNIPVLLECGKSRLGKYVPDENALRELKLLLPLESKSGGIRCEGSLFSNGVLLAKESQKSGLGGNPEHCDFFKDEIWILPDGSEEFCPNPERRFGNALNNGAKCENCPLFKVNP